MELKRGVLIWILGLVCSCTLCGCGSNKGPTLNGVSLSEYQIVGETEDYGTKLAVEKLRAGIKKLTDGEEPECEYGVEATKNVIYIADGPSNVGTYSIETDGNIITLNGPGINGRLLAVKELLALLEGQEDITIDSAKKPMFKLSKAAKLIEAGEISIGFIGDSVTTETMAAYDPWPYLLKEKMQEAYPNTNFQTNNVALHGKTTEWGADNISELLLKTGYCDLIFISLGTNDSFNDITGEQTKTNYMSMIEQIYAKNPDAEIIFVMYGRDFELRGIEGKEDGKISDYMKHMLTLSEEYQIPIIEVMSALYDACVEYAGEEDALEEGWKHYVIDDVHPFGIGQDLYCDVVWTQMKQALQSK